MAERTISETKNIGLRGIPVADTKISAIDGERGQLIYRGFNVLDLVQHSTFEEVAYLLLFGNLPNSEQLESFQESLAEEREIPQALLQSMEVRPKSSHPMDVLQSSVAMLADHDPQARVMGKEADLAKAKRLIAKIPTIVAAWDRIRKDKSPVKPDPSLGHAAHFLYLVNGEVPDPGTAKDFDICLVLHADHTFNASTFAAREVASTRAHMYASVAAALGALSGELHGGANAQVMEMLLEIGEVVYVRPWIIRRLEAGERVMGMGHAVYKTDDPRATVLRSISERLGKRIRESKWYEMTRLIEMGTKEEFKKSKGKEIYPNVDLYSASVYHMMGIDRDLFTPVFAISRISGWSAHIIEEKYAEAQPRATLYRPKADYIGTYCGPEACTYIPIENRQ
ncbi:MAG: citrate (Si)-synthase [Proteobacteria bacterium]|nr:citrate (Si)-synthase [Pseudomonadota bacterium]